MTTTDNRPAFKLTEADLPTSCPDWCDGKASLHADDLAEIYDGDGFHTEGDFQEARRVLREHTGSVADENLPSLYFDISGADRPRLTRQGGTGWEIGLAWYPGDEGPTYDWDEPVVTFGITLPRKGDGLRLTAAEALFLARQLVRAADMLVER